MKWKGARFCALAALCLAAILSATLGAQTKVKPAMTGSTAIKVDGNIIKSYIAYMAADEREGRGTEVLGGREERPVLHPELEVLEPQRNPPRTPGRGRQPGACLRPAGSPDAGTVLRAGSGNPAG